MKLPHLEEPQRYQGLYIFDFGDWTAVGYTGEEIAALLDSEQYRSGKVYRIHRAWPDGRVELRGVASERFHLESGLLFYRDNPELARQDYANLVASARVTSPPSRAFVQLAELPAEGGSASRYVTALIYPAECDEDVSAWLMDQRYDGGDVVEGGVSQVTDYYRLDKSILERDQLWSANSERSRSPEQVLATVRNAVQR
ncbi:MAG: hypothetical protein JNG88_00675 [Phycisphaerales bacterium]|nr:hypothetical protein [Phycisphaerales bacterium]